MQRLSIFSLVYFQYLVSLVLITLLIGCSTDANQDFCDSSKVFMTAWMQGRQSQMNLMMTEPSIKLVDNIPPNVWKTLPDVRFACEGDSMVSENERITLIRQLGEDSTIFPLRWVQLPDANSTMVWKVDMVATLNRVAQQQNQSQIEKMKRLFKK